jgi:hypothetical protein
MDTRKQYEKWCSFLSNLFERGFAIKTAPAGLYYNDYNKCIKIIVFKYTDTGCCVSREDFILVSGLTAEETAYLIFSTTDTLAKQVDANIEKIKNLI